MIESGQIWKDKVGKRKQFYKVIRVKDIDIYSEYPMVEYIPYDEPSAESARMIDKEEWLRLVELSSVREYKLYQIKKELKRLREHPELDFSIDESSIVVRSRKLKARWSTES
jgi:hypothetical protein